jgi:hypothetical protein
MTRTKCLGIVAFWSLALNFLLLADLGVQNNEFRLAVWRTLNGDTSQKVQLGNFSFAFPPVIYGHVHMAKTAGTGEFMVECNIFRASHLTHTVVRRNQR